MEFYFSDANLPTDEFLLKQVRSNPDGYVAVKVLAGFKKMQKLSRNLRVLAAALAASEELEVSPDGTAVRYALAATSRNNCLGPKKPRQLQECIKGVGCRSQIAFSVPALPPLTQAAGAAARRRPGRGPAEDGAGGQPALGEADDRGRASPL